MEDKSEVIVTAERELLKSTTCKRLSENPDFTVFRQMLEDKKNEYREMLEGQLEDNRSNLLRGGIIAIKEVLSLFDLTGGREKSLVDFLKELKES